MADLVAGTDCDFEELGHTAEVGMRVRSASAATLFACAGQAMFALIGAESDRESFAAQRTVTLDAPDIESLLVDWLNELVYLHETTGEVYPECRVIEWTPTSLSATITGYQPSQSPALHVKAVTYHELQVREEQDGWMAQVYCDI